MEPIKARVKWFRGAYGFLEDEHGQDYFVHHTAIVVEDEAEPTGIRCRTCRDAWEEESDRCPNCGGPVEPIKFRKLAELQDVEILEWQPNGDKGLKATRVRKL